MVCKLYSNKHFLKNKPQIREGIFNTFLKITKVYCYIFNTSKRKRNQATEKLNPSKKSEMAIQIKKPPLVNKLIHKSTHDIKDQPAQVTLCTA